MTFTPPYTSPCLQVSAANVWCAKYRPKALKLRVLTGVHSPDQFRVQVHHFENGFKKPTLPLLMTYIFRGHSPTWMTFHGTLTAQLGQIWIHQRRINARWISMLWWGKQKNLKSGFYIFHSFHSFHIDNPNSNTSFSPGVVTCSCRKRLRSQSEKNPSIRISNFAGPDNITSYYVSVFALWRHESFYNVFME